MAKNEGTEFDSAGYPHKVPGPFVPTESCAAIAAAGAENAAPTTFAVCGLCHGGPLNGHVAGCARLAEELPIQEIESPAQNAAVESPDPFRRFEGKLVTCDCDRLPHFLSYGCSGDIQLHEDPSTADAVHAGILSPASNYLHKTNVAMESEGNSQESEGKTAAESTCSMLRDGKRCGRPKPEADSACADCCDDLQRTLEKLSPQNAAMEANEIGPFVTVNGLPLSDFELDGARVIDKHGKDLGLVEGFIPRQRVLAPEECFNCGSENVSVRVPLCEDCHEELAEVQDSSEGQHPAQTIVGADQRGHASPPDPGATSTGPKNPDRCAPESPAVFAGMTVDFALTLLDMVGSAASGRCMVCRWPLASSADRGCVQGNCSFRPHQESPEHQGWRQRTDALIFAKKYIAGKVRFRQQQVNRG